LAAFFVGAAWFGWVVALWKFHVLQKCCAANLWCNKVVVKHFCSVIIDRTKLPSREIDMMLGNIATGADFYGRETECADLWRYLEKNHVVASGPRRLGKSSIVNRMREQAEADGVMARHVDVQGVEGAQGFIDQISLLFPDATISGYLSKMGQGAKKWLGAVKKIDVKGPGGIGGALELQINSSLPWFEAAQALQGRLSDAPVLIFIDEFSVFLHKLLQQDQKQAEALLAWLRAWRVKPGVACRFLFTGSIGLNALLEGYGLSALVNDCFEYPIGPFKRVAAMSMMRQFAEDAEWMIIDETLGHLVDKVGWLSPYYLCLLLDQTMQAARDRRDEAGDSTALKELIISDVDDAYERLLSSRSRFIHWEQRLNRDLQGADLDFAKLILTALAKKPEGLSQKQLHSRLSKLEADPDARALRQQIIASKLQEEGYVSAPDADSRVKFLSFLLRDYWSRNHV
jgi:hypothetical protein